MKKIILALAVVATAMFAKADFLYWQIANRSEGFTTATLWVNDGSNKSEVEMTLAQGVDPEATPAVLTGTSTGLMQTDISDYASDKYSFFVELATYSADGSITTERWLNEFSYTDLASKGYVSTGSIGVPGYAVAGGIDMDVGGGYIIPEPTSGMLLLLGGALMALRRRRRA